MSSLILLRLCSSDSLDFTLLTLFAAEVVLKALSSASVWHWLTKDDDAVCIMHTHHARTHVHDV